MFLKTGDFPKNGEWIWGFLKSGDIGSGDLSEVRTRSVKSTANLEKVFCFIFRCHIDIKSVMDSNLRNPKNVVI